jgi:hypothetical protein
MIRYFENYPYGFSDTKFVYANTKRNSKLRLLYKDLIAGNGPLRFTLQWVDHEEWMLLLAKGGELVKDCIQDGFTNSRKSDKRQPWGRMNYERYLQKRRSLEVKARIKKRYPRSI